ncbi:hypothetical protein [Burkholderia savannae]|uniref:hypothetical protein n=1 Tax=Burkholderia savannae TaxID=1637837 RepID=UPI0012E3BDE1|nr:hypothetical protein [Burkholderia savannae]
MQPKASQKHHDGNNGKRRHRLARLLSGSSFCCIFVKFVPSFVFRFIASIMRTQTFHANIAHRPRGARAAVVAVATPPLLRSTLAAPLAAARRLT